MKVEVCYAEATRATRIEVSLAEGAMLGDAVESSAIASLLSLDLRDLTFAIFGRRATARTVLEEGDRVELLRALRVDPKEARHRRAAKKRAQGERSKPAGPRG